MRCLAAVLLFLFGILVILAAPARARGAEPPAPHAVVVVAISPGTSELDAPSLRAAIGVELQADAVAEDDARAVSAGGRFDVSVDRTAGQLVVSYSGGAAPLVRRVALPADPQATARAAVALAGNLGRDEAADLAVEIRRSTAPVQPPARPESDREMEASAREELTLMRMLADYARRDRTARIATSLTLIGSGVAAMATRALDPSRSGDDRVLSLVSPLGFPLIFLGVFGYPFVDSDFGLTRRSRFERLSEYYPPESETGRPWARAKVEQMWKKEAIESRRTRTDGLLPLVGFGVGEAALGTFFLVDGDLHHTLQASIDIVAITVGVGATVWGVTAAQSDTRTESRLHDYERAVGRPIVEEVGLGVAPAPGGATLSLAGRF